MTIACVTLKDSRTPATATVAVGFGFNCFQFAVERHGKRVEILWADPAFSSGQARPSGSGIPLMFPFPGRIAKGILRWEGREYRLPEGDGRGNAIHGFVMNRPWRVLEQAEDRVVGEFHAAQDDPALLELWPADFLLRVTYTLRQAVLSCRLEAHNPGSTPLPCGFGTHPYFRLPIGGTDAARCVVTLPVTAQWELADMIPTGRRVELPDAAAYQRGRPYAELQLDNAFTGLQLTAGRHRATIFDPESQIQVEQLWDPLFRECVVYTPGHREAICIEPLSCVPGAFDLTARGIDAGLQIIPPGKSVAGSVEIGVVG